MPRDVTTQWNSTFDMLDFAVDHHLAIDDITAERTASLRKYEMDDEEWKITLQLRNTLKVRVSHIQLWKQILTCSQVFKDATLFFSRSTPSLVTVIPAMDFIDETLTDNSINPNLEPSIRAALGIAKKTLNRYYNTTDQSEVYRIAMGTFSLSCCN
jgi:hypothetical protein